MNLKRKRPDKPGTGKVLSYVWSRQSDYNRCRTDAKQALINAALAGAIPRHRLTRCLRVLELVDA